MSLEYKEREILMKESDGRPLIGYINPYGNIINLSRLVGEPGHGNWRNPVTPIIMHYMSFVILNTNVKELKKLGKELGLGNKFYDNNFYPGFKEIVKRGAEFGREINFESYNYFKEDLNTRFEKEIERMNFFISFYVKNNFEDFYKRDVYEKLAYDLICLFQKTYSNDDFFNSIGMVPKVLDKSTVLDKYKGRYEDGDKLYYGYLTVQLMSYMKDICIQYLGYHSLERAIPNADLNIHNNIFECSNGYTFADNPRTITTSEPNVNDTFYNWLLMDWEIQQVPRYYWNENEKCFELESEILKYYETEKEKILGKEIASIKRLVPLKERPKYFR